MTNIESMPAIEITSDQLTIKGIEYVEFYVSNAFQTAQFYRMAMGFTPIGYAGLETGLRDRQSYVVGQNQIRLIMTGPLNADNEIAEHVMKHGDGVKDIAFTVGDAEYAFEETVKRGALPVAPPSVHQDKAGQLIKATISINGAINHSFIQRTGDTPLLPNFNALSTNQPQRSVGFNAIDHVALIAGENKLANWCEHYQQILGFRQSHTEDIITEYSSMNSKVMQSINGNVLFPIIEPAEGKRKSQIHEFLNYHNGPGVQHLAFSCDDLIDTVRQLRGNGIEFLFTPDSYYETVNERVDNLAEPVSELRDVRALVDRDSHGYLIQIFTKPMQGRPTTFIEVIQRKGAQGFGGGNIKALYQAVEREQAKRGNL